MNYIQPPKKMNEEMAEVFVFRLETHLQHYIQERLGNAGIYWIHISDKSMSGIPDLIMCIKGFFIAVELKVGKNTASELQKSEIKKIIKSKGVAGVAHTWGEFKDVVNDAIYELGQAPIEWGVNDGENIRRINSGVC